MLRSRTLALPVLASLLVAALASAQSMPRQLDYQGQLADPAGEPVADGAYNAVFRLYDVAEGGTALWTENQSVSVRNGLFSVVLGSITPLDALAFDRQYWLGVDVNSTGELAPRTALTAAPYSLRAADAERLGGQPLSALLPSAGGAVGGNLSVGGTLAVTGATTLSGALAVTGATTLSGALGVTGTTTLSGGLGVTGATTLSGGLGVTGATTLSGGLALPADNLVAGTDQFVLAGGNVGIGTSSPGTKLDVRGHLTLDPGTSPGIYTGTGASELNRYLLVLNSAEATNASGVKAGGLLVADAFAYANPGKNDLIVKGNVGIGTPAPGAKLEVKGSGGGNVLLGEWGANSAYGAIGLANSLGSTEYNLLSSATDKSLYINRPAGASIYFREASGSPQLLVAPGGNVGIGTASPVAPLDIANRIRRYHLVRTFPTVAGGWVEIGSVAGNSSVIRVTITKQNSYAVASKTYLLATCPFGTGGGWRVVAPLAQTAPTNGNEWNLEANWSGLYGPLLLRIRVSQVGDTAPDASADVTLEVEGAVTLTPTSGSGTIDPPSGFYDGSLITQKAQGVGIAVLSPAYTLHVGGSVGIGGDVYATGCYQSQEAGTIGGTCESDARLKHDVESLSGSLEAIRRLRPVRFEWNEGSGKSGPAVGFLAQEVEQVLPHLVTTGEDGTKRVRYDLELQMHLVQAVREQQAQIENLRQELADSREQQAQLDALRQLVCLDHPEARACLR